MLVKIKVQLLQDKKATHTPFYEIKHVITSTIR